MTRYRTFTVTPRLPERLSPLLGIARNLWWCWNPEAVDLFRRIDHDRWTASGHNPVALLGITEQERLAELETDPVFLAHMDRVAQALDRYLVMPTWAGGADAPFGDAQIGYFSMEYALHECMQIYSGGLGVLSGDHVKSASELGLPMVAVGLAYRQGYFHQYLTHDGWQQEVYPENDFYNLPVTPVRDDEGGRIAVEVAVRGRQVRLEAWRVQVGRVALYLLDTNLDANAPEDRSITHQLYAPGVEMRIRQEVVLGVGGVRLLQALGIEPEVCHMNEGHAAFLGLERIRGRMASDDLDFWAALEAVRAGNVFTTHTPVPAGIDMFPPDLVEAYLGPLVREMGVSVEDLLALGRQNPTDGGEPLSMAVLAIRLSGHRNGVSRLHGRVSRRMWAGVWPGIPTSEVPIGHVTNGIHVRTWLSDEMARLFDRYLGPQWVDEPLDQGMWERVRQIPDNELWRAKDRLKERLIGFVRRRLATQLQRRGAPQGEIRAAHEVLDPETLTFGFARRFATYKRGTLLFLEPERLARLLNDPDRPVQVIFAGKAHPADQGGKRFIQEIVHQCRRPEFRNRIVFLEDYDLNLARYLVQGVDVWLNTPRRPLEACGTSGMKVPPNAGLHVSVLDGWWDEAFSDEVGWAIGQGEEYDDPVVHDGIEGKALYDLIEHEIAPLYYARSEDGLPRGWIARVKTSIERLTPVYNTNRMVREYSEHYYLPALHHWQRLSRSRFQAARALAQWRGRVTEAWPGVRVVEVEAPESAERRVGDEIPVRCVLGLSGVDPADVRVEVYHGPLGPAGEIEDPERVSMRYAMARGDDLHLFEGQIPCRRTGRHGFAVRVLPHHPNLLDPWELGLVEWGV